VMVAPTYPEINGAPAWERKVVLKWAGGTGRLRSPETIEEYRTLFGTDPWPPRAGGRVPSGQLQPRRKPKEMA